MGNLRWLGALALAALLLARPAEASLGAARAMALWSASVAPAVFPFLALLPLLTGRDAGFCTACFSGEYPTAVPVSGEKHRFERKIHDD